MEDNEKLLEEINASWRNNEIKFMTIEGLVTTSIENISKQPANGVLYDLNRDYATIETLAKKSKNLKWINDLALSRLFEYYFNKTRELEQENETLRSNIKKSEESEKSQEIKPVQKSESTKKYTRATGVVREGFDDSIVFQI